MNRMNLRKVFIRLFIILIMNKSNEILKRHEIKSKKLLILRDMRILEHLRSTYIESVISIKNYNKIIIII